MEELFIGDRDRDTLKDYLRGRVADDCDSNFMLSEQFGGVIGHGVGQVCVGRYKKLSLLVSSCLRVQLDAASQWDL